ncbi:MAG: sulfite exporter TauE/SafE family protein [Bacteroidia bacterium]
MISQECFRQEELFQALAGLLGTGGAIQGFGAFNSLLSSKEAFIATSAIIDMGIDLSRTVVYGLNGYIHKDDMYLIPGLLITGFVGTYAGKQLLRFVSENQFRILVLVLIIGIGINRLLSKFYNG